MQSVSGGGHHGSGLLVDTTDHASLGLLFARKGNSAGQQLISRRWTDLIQPPTRPIPATDT